MTHPEPTTAQLAVLRAIAAGLERDGYAPTRRELGAVLDCQSSNVQEILRRLAKGGWITTEPLRPRTLRLTAAAVELLAGCGKPTTPER